MLSWGWRDRLAKPFFGPFFYLFLIVFFGQTFTFEGLDKSFVKIITLSKAERARAKYRIVVGISGSEILNQIAPAFRLGNQSSKTIFVAHSDFNTHGPIQTGEGVARIGRKFWNGKIGNNLPSARIRVRRLQRLRWNDERARWASRRLSWQLLYRLRDAGGHFIGYYSTAVGKHNLQIAAPRVINANRHVKYGGHSSFHLPTKQLSLLTGSGSRFCDLRRLLLDLPQYQKIKHSKGDGDQHADCLNPRLELSPKRVSVTVLGIIIFAVCWVKLRSYRDFSTEWLNYLVIVGVFAGLAIYTCGLYLLLERPHFVCQCAQNAQFALIHASWFAAAVAL